MSLPSRAKILAITNSLPPQNMTETPFPVAFFEAIPDALAAIAPDGKIVQINSQVEMLFGYQPGELIGQKIEVLVPERYRPQHRSHRHTLAQAPKVRRNRRGPGSIRKATGRLGISSGDQFESGTDGKQDFGVKRDPRYQ